MPLTGCAELERTAETCDKDDERTHTTVQLKFIGQTVKVIFESECQFPSLESAISQLSQSQFGALRPSSMEAPFSEM